VWIDDPPEFIYELLADDVTIFECFPSCEKEMRRFFPLSMKSQALLKKKNEKPSWQRDFWFGWR
jgi:hypothetical protein